MLLLCSMEIYAQLYHTHSVPTTTGDGPNYLLTMLYSCFLGPLKNTTSSLWSRLSASVRDMRMCSNIVRSASPSKNPTLPLHVWRSLGPVNMATHSPRQLRSAKSRALHGATCTCYIHVTTSSYSGLNKIIEL